MMYKINNKMFQFAIDERFFWGEAGDSPYLLVTDRDIFKFGIIY